MLVLFYWCTKCDGNHLVCCVSANLRKNYVRPVYGLNDPVTRFKDPESGDDDGSGV